MPRCFLKLNGTGVRVLATMLIVFISCIMRLACFLGRSANSFILHPYFRLLCTSSGF